MCLITRVYGKYLSTCKSDTNAKSIVGKLLLDFNEVHQYQNCSNFVCSIRVFQMDLRYYYYVFTTYTLKLVWRVCFVGIVRAYMHLARLSVRMDIPFPHSSKPFFLIHLLRYQVKLKSSVICNWHFTAQQTTLFALNVMNAHTSLICYQCFIVNFYTHDVCAIDSLVWGFINDTTYIHTFICT